MTHLLLTIRFFEERYHGLLDRDGPPEWPPSPFRLFQALVAGLARRGELDSALGESLAWLQTLDPPTIISPMSHPGQVVTRFVPNNDGDKKPDRQSRLTGKTFRPTIMRDPPEIHYLWLIEAELVPKARLVCDAARYLTCLGWGIDMAYADGRLIGRDEVGRLIGVRWHPRKGVIRDSGMLRVPVGPHETTANTLDDLRRAHKSALNRIEHDRPLNSVEKPRTFGRVFYESNKRPLARPFAAFELWQPIEKLATLPPGKSKFRPFDPLRVAFTVVPMVRRAAAEVAEAAHRGKEWINTFIHGHTPDGRDRLRGGPDVARFAYLPLPSLEQRRDPKGRRTAYCGSVRRLLVVGPPGRTAEVDWARRALSGRELTDEETGQPAALLALISENDPNLRAYIGTAAVWSTVTPVVLPGHDDGEPAEAERLLRRAFVQAGASTELVEAAELEWRRTGFRPGVDLASRYERPQPTRTPRYHVRVRWPVPVCGPLAVGALRYRGLGVFAAESP
jgi:CRISPR-associated protein Csb2